LFEHVQRFLVEELGIRRELASETLVHDYEASGARGRLSFMPGAGSRTARAGRQTLGPLRQVRHLHR
jgi:hypothetical protein